MGNVRRGSHSEKYKGMEGAREGWYSQNSIAPLCESMYWHMSWYRVVRFFGGLSITFGRFPSSHIHKEVHVCSTIFFKGVPEKQGILSILATHGFAIVFVLLSLPAKYGIL